LFFACKIADLFRFFR